MTHSSLRGLNNSRRKKGTTLLRNSSFKDALAKFLLRELRKEYNAPIVGNKTVYISHGGECIKLHVNSMGMMVVEEPAEFQGNHEEADTLLAFHAYRCAGTILIRSSDTDVLTILVGLAPKMPETSTMMMDFGSANNRRLINITNISKQLEHLQPGLCEALIGFHALTGCDFNSAFYRKGKAIPFGHLEKEVSYVSALRSLCSDVIDTPAITAYAGYMVTRHSITSMKLGTSLLSK